MKSTQPSHRNRKDCKDEKKLWREPDSEPVGVNDVFFKYGLNNELRFSAAVSATWNASSMVSLFHFLSQTTRAKRAWTIRLYRTAGKE